MAHEWDYSHFVLGLMTLEMWASGMYMKWIVFVLKDWFYPYELMMLWHSNLPFVARANFLHSHMLQIGLNFSSTQGKTMEWKTLQEVSSVWEGEPAHVDSRDTN